MHPVGRQVEPGRRRRPGGSPRWRHLNHVKRCRAQPAAAQPAAVEHRVERRPVARVLCDGTKRRARLPQRTLDLAGPTGQPVLGQPGRHGAAAVEQVYRAVRPLPQRVDQVQRQRLAPQWSFKEIRHLTTITFLTGKTKPAYGADVPHAYLQQLVTPSVVAAQERYGSRTAQARHVERADVPDRLGPDEAAFIAVQDHFVLASVGETGWPYVQHRGGPAGFLRVLDDGATLAWADFRGNRQYVSVGNARPTRRSRCCCSTGRTRRG